MKDKSKYVECPHCHTQQRGSGYIFNPLTEQDVQQCVKCKTFYEEESWINVGEQFEQAKNEGDGKMRYRIGCYGWPIAVKTLYKQDIFDIFKRCSITPGEIVEHGDLTVFYFDNQKDSLKIRRRLVVRSGIVVFLREN